MKFPAPWSQLITFNPSVTKLHCVAPNFLESYPNPLTIIQKLCAIAAENQTPAHNSRALNLILCVFDCLPGWQ